MVNGNEYSWEDISILIPGKATPVRGITDIMYTVKKDHTNIYGKGDKPVAMGRGKKEYEGEITLLQSEVEGMLSTLLPGQDITNIPAGIVTVAYAPIGGVSVVDQLLFVRFKEMPKGMKTGDGNMEVKIPLMIGDILFGV